VSSMPSTSVSAASKPASFVTTRPILSNSRKGRTSGWRHALARSTSCNGSLGSKMMRHTRRLHGKR
jgi:hypothetical protein